MLGEGQQLPEYWILVGVTYANDVYSRTELRLFWLLLRHVVWRMSNNGDTRCLVNNISKAVGKQRKERKKRPDDGGCVRDIGLNEWGI